MVEPLQAIFALDAAQIPDHLRDACMEIDDEFPLHYSTGIVEIIDDGNPFAEWLKTLGFKFEIKHGYKVPRGSLAVWGT